jgi:hypothetical protein
VKKINWWVVDRVQNAPERIPNFVLEGLGYGEILKRRESCMRSMTFV